MGPRVAPVRNNWRLTVVEGNHETTLVVVVGDDDAANFMERSIIGESELGCVCVCVDRTIYLSIYIYRIVSVCVLLMRCKCKFFFGTGYFIVDVQKDRRKPGGISTGTTAIPNKFKRHYEPHQHSHPPARTTTTTTNILLLWINNDDYWIDSLRRMPLYPYHLVSSRYWRRTWCWHKSSPTIMPFMKHCGTYVYIYMYVYIYI